VNGRLYSADPRVDRHHLISISSYHTMRKKKHSMFPNFSFHSLCPRLCGSSMLGGIISSHPISTLLKPEPLIVMNSVWISRIVRQSVDDVLSSLQLHHFTTTSFKWCISNFSIRMSRCYSDYTRLPSAARLIV